MTNEEAIGRIRDHMDHHGIGHYPHLKIKEALDLAISALQSVGKDITAPTKNDHFRDFTKMVPLTLDQLRRTDMELVETKGPFSDATSIYDVKFRKGTTVRQFISEVLNTRAERGSIEIVRGSKVKLFQDGLKYSHGGITGKCGVGISEEENEKVVLRAEAHGGWGAMDYFLWLED